MVVGGESFWTVVYPAFIDRELTKTDLRQIVKAGLQRTQGNYRKLVELFRMAPGDYKRFLAFLYSTTATCRSTASASRAATSRRLHRRRALNNSDSRTEKRVHRAYARRAPVSVDERC